MTRAALWHRLPDDFERQLDALAGSVDEFHFDDGYDDVLRAAAALEVRGLRGVFFIVSGWLGVAGQATQANVRALADRGHEVGNHTAHHVWAPKVPGAVLADDILTGQHALADLTGRWPTRLAWPYGQHDVRTDALAWQVSTWATEPRGITPAEVVVPRSLADALRVRP